MPNFTLTLTLVANVASREDALQMAHNAHNHLMETFNDDGSLSGGRVDVAYHSLGKPYAADVHINPRIPIGTRVAHYSAGSGVREGVVIGSAVTPTARTLYRVRFADGTEQYSIPVYNLQVLPDLHHVVTGGQYRYLLDQDVRDPPAGNRQHNDQVVTVLCSLGPNVDGSEGFEVMAADGWKGWASSRELRALEDAKPSIVAEATMKVAMLGPDSVLGDDFPEPHTAPQKLGS